MGVWIIYDITEDNTIEKLVFNLINKNNNNIFENGKKNRNFLYFLILVTDLYYKHLSTTIFIPYILFYY